MPINLPLQLPVFSLKKNLRKGLIVTYLEVKGLKVKSIFNKNIIKLKDNIEYIKEAADTVIIL